MVFAQGYVIEYLHRTLNIVAVEDLIVDIVDTQCRHIQRDPESINKGRVGALVLSTFVSRNEHNPCLRLCFNAVPGHGNGAIVEGGAQVVHGIAG